MTIIAFIVLGILSLLAVVLLVFVLFNSLGFFTGAPFATTPASIVAEVFQLVEVGERDIVYDLGSGDGRILIAAARQGARGVGWEINFPLYLWSIRKIRKLGLSHKIAIHFGNFWRNKFSGATVIFAFLLPENMTRLEKKINREVAPGTKVVTYLARFPDKQPKETTPHGVAIYQF